MDSDKATFMALRMFGRNDKVKKELARAGEDANEIIKTLDQAYWEKKNGKSIKWD